MYNTLVVENFENIDVSDLKIPMIVIYEKPKDFPNNYIARLWDTNKPTNIAVVRDTLEELREVIPNHMVKFDRNIDDDKVIVEVWV